jgi:molybdopterin-guanine dinucleotide biosynthesis protein A
MPVTAIAAYILAGGESSRMGRNKALLEIDGMPLLVRTARLVEEVAGTPSVIGPKAMFAVFGLECIEDDWRGAGPLGGIATALRASREEWILVVACDLPYLTKEWLNFLATRAKASSADAIIPQNLLGAEPLCAMYRKRGDAAIRTALERGVRKVTDGLAGLKIEEIAPAEWKSFDSEGMLFKNMNTPADYEEARARLSGPANR